MTPGAGHEVETVALDGGLEGVTLRCPATGLAATWAPSAGMLGCALRKDAAELLHVPGGAAAYARTGATAGIPLLAPWANRLARLSYQAAGRRVELERDAPGIRTEEHGLPIHGLLGAARGWRVLEAEGSPAAARLTATFDLAEHPELLRSFPFPHVLRYEATLVASTVRIVVTLEAGMQGPVPVSFGFHPYLRVPGARERWSMRCTMGEHLPADGRGIPTGVREPTDIATGPVGDRTWDDGYAGPGGAPQFRLAGDGVALEVSLEAGYAYAQLYAPRGSPFICFEPMTAPTAALTHGGPELPLVAPGGKFTASFAITVAADRAVGEERE